MRIKFLQPMSLQSQSGPRSFDVGETVDLPEREANRLLFVAGHRVKADEEEFRILEPVYARKVTPIAFRGPEWEAPKWVKGVILELNTFRQQALIASNGEQFWASLSTLRKW